MHQPLLVLPGPSRPDGGARATPFVGAARLLRAGIPLMSLAALMVGCASHTLMPKEQAQAIQSRDRALSPHSDAIQAAIRQSGRLGALAFLDDVDGRLVVIPGDSPAEAWARHAASSSGNGPGGSVTIPAVVSFVYRADLPKAPETVLSAVLQQRHREQQDADVRAEALGTSVAAVSDQQRRTEETLGTRVAGLQRELDTSVATRAEMQATIAAAREEMQKAANSLADDLAATRKFLLQTAQLGWVNHELSVENATGLRGVSAASQELVANTARLADALRQASDSLNGQLKQLADRLDSIQNKINSVR